MAKRFVAIWFRYLKTDWLSIRQPTLKNVPFVLSLPLHGRNVISAVNTKAQQQGIYPGMPLADARAVIPSLVYKDDNPHPSGKLLRDIALWCIRYSPIIAVDPPDGIIIDATGCAHLWGDESQYLTAINSRFSSMGYDVHVGMADTIGAAWAVSRFGKNKTIITPNRQQAAIVSLPSAALRLETETLEKLDKLGLRQIKSFIMMPRTALRRRFGDHMLLRIDQALACAEEFIQPVHLPTEWQERLSSLEPIATRTGIEIALQQLLQTLCNRLQLQQKGLRAATFNCYRIDGKTETIEIGTNRATYNAEHLFKLFELKLDSIEPALGIELFILEAAKVEEAPHTQEKLWESACGLQDTKFTELIDRIAGKLNDVTIHRFIPDEHYLPERSIKVASSINEELKTEWNTDKPRPVQLLNPPEPIEVSAPIPDYPPMLFRYKGELHTIKKADGPERIEQEWWIQEGEHRDYYAVEDENGNRFWVFRSGHYTGEKKNQWFLHGFFA